MSPTCPSDSVFQDWIGRGLDRVLLRRLDDHVETCASCRARMILAAQAEAPVMRRDATGRPPGRALDVERARQMARLLLSRELV